MLARGLREINKEASQLDPKLPAEEKGVVRTALMGGSMAKQEIAKYNEDIDETCNYCREANSIANHIRWHCKYFDEHRKKQDPELAVVPFKHLRHCIQMWHCAGDKGRQRKVVLGSGFR